MNITGKYNRNNEFVDCRIIIKYGKIQELAFDSPNNPSPIILAEFLDKHNSDFTIEKHYDEKNAPYNANYFIKINGGNKPIIIYLKLKYYQIIALKYRAKKYLIQSDDMKKDILKYIIGGILGFVGTLIIQSMKA